MKSLVRHIDHIHIRMELTRGWSMLLTKVFSDFLLQINIILIDLLFIAFNFEIILRLLYNFICFEGRALLFPIKLHSERSLSSTTTKSW